MSWLRLLNLQNRTPRESHSRTPVAVLHSTPSTPTVTHSLNFRRLKLIKVFKSTTVTVNAFSAGDVAPSRNLWCGMPGSEKACMPLFAALNLDIEAQLNHGLEFGLGV